jgi:glycosyltransferase involved in cell wall biosynthesis
MKNIKITIVIPTYNSGKTIRQCLSSLLDQTNKEFKVLIADGGSEDNTLYLINKYKKKLSLKIVSKKDSGIYNAANKLISNVYTGYYLFLGSDDFLYATAVNEYLKIINTHEFDIVSFPVKSANKVIFPKSFFIKDGPLSMVTVFSVGTLVKKELHNKVGIFDENFKIAADYDFLYKCKLINIEIFHGNEVVGFFNLNGISSVYKTKAIIERFEIDLSYSKNFALTFFISIARLIYNYSLFKNYNKIKKSI